MTCGGTYHQRFLRKLETCTGIIAKNSTDYSRIRNSLPFLDKMFDKFKVQATRQANKDLDSSKQAKVVQNLKT
jgi:hypothetical protein